MFGHNVSTTCSSAHQAGPLCLKHPKPFLETKAGLGLDSSPSFPPCSSPRLRNLREGYVGRRTGEDACLFGDGLNLLGGKSPGASEGEEGTQGNNL